MGIGLPIIVDIAISLVFIYFTLSLLASEVQNLLKALLQWRAVHLKKSIEGLLVGNDSTKAQEARRLAHRLYAHPLIRSLTHQTKNGVADAMRAPMRLLSQLVQANPDRRVFGHHTSGPSKLPTAAFTASLLSNFDFIDIYRQLMGFRLEVTLQGMATDLAMYHRHLAPKINLILVPFKAKQISLATALQAIAIEIDNNESLLKSSAFTEYFSSPQAIEHFASTLQLSLADTIRAVRHYLMLKEDSLSTIFKALGDNPTFEQAKQCLSTFRLEHPDLETVLPGATDQSLLALALILTSPPIKKKIEALPTLPNALGDNLEMLADKALDRIDDLSQETAQFEQEIATWFNDSMARANGVYRRNSKLVALMIGLVVAIVGNADSFYMIDRFAKEKTITASVIGVMDQLPQDALAQADRINELSSQLSLPVGWQTPILDNQAKFRVLPLDFLPFWIERIPGWIVTGIAVSMGSSFWYDLLKKLVDVNKAGEATQTSNLGSASRD